MATYVDPRITHPTKHRIVAAGLDDVREDISEIPTVISSNDIVDASDIGREVLTSDNAESILTTIGAAASNHNHAIAADTASGLESAANLQAAFIALSARIAALEDAMEALNSPEE